MNTMQITVTVPEACDSDEMTKMMQDDPTLTKARATAKILQKTLGGWATITVTHDPSAEGTWSPQQ